MFYGYYKDWWMLMKVRLEMNEEEEGRKWRKENKVNSCFWILSLCKFSFLDFVPITFSLTTHKPHLPRHAVRHINVFVIDDEGRDQKQNIYNLMICFRTKKYTGM